MFSARRSIPRVVCTAIRMQKAFYNAECEKARWEERTAVVTGASWGIGRAIVKDMVKAKIYTIGLDIRKDRMDELRNSLPKKLQCYFEAVECDVTNLECVNHTFDAIIENYGGVDIMVNNAGILIPGQLVTLDPTSIRRVVDVNIMGVVHCTQRAFKSMVERKFDGHIVNICSILGHSVPNLPVGEVQNLNIYPPTKFAVKAINEILRQEMRGLKHKIKTTSISPGVTDTEIVPDSIKLGKMLKPEDISAGVMYALFTPKHLNVYELTIKPVGEQL